ncbi:MAG: hypothetical protein KDK99_04425, partial [Verrucomicrobiales bacterium]|nr:hypothetical protein [Verrucomicrobiales bacterium]
MLAKVHCSKCQPPLLMITCSRTATSAKQSQHSGQAHPTICHISNDGDPGGCKKEPCRINAIVVTAWARKKEGLNSHDLTRSTLFRTPTEGRDSWGMFY